MKLAGRLFLLSALVIVAAWGAPSEDKGKDKDLTWEEFKSQHKKQYESDEKESKARANFHSNDAKIKKHNLEHGAGNVSWFMRHNSFSDMTMEEFAHAMLKPVEVDNSTVPKGSQLAPLIEANSSAGVSRLLDYVDWSIVRYMGVRNQGVCGSCYAFASIGLYEWYHSYKYGGVPDFSEQQVVSCSLAYPGNLGCNGGHVFSTFQYLIDNGVALERTLPYQQTWTPTVQPCKYWYGLKAATLQSYRSYPSYEQKWNDYGLLNAMTSANGPVAIYIHMGADWGQFYGGNVFDGYCNGPQNHAVMIAGWGIKDGKPYWHVKNSWGYDWGTNGFFFLLRGINQCNVGDYYAFWPIL